MVVNTTHNLKKTNNLCVFYITCTFRIKYPLQRNIVFQYKQLNSLHHVSQSRTTRNRPMIASSSSSSASMASLRWLLSSHPTKCPIASYIQFAKGPKQDASNLTTHYYRLCSKLYNENALLALYKPGNTVTFIGTMANV